TSDAPVHASESRGSARGAESVGPPIRPFTLRTRPGGDGSGRRHRRHVHRGEGGGRRSEERSLHREGRDGEDESDDAEDGHPDRERMVARDARKEARTELRRHLSSRAKEVVFRLSRAGGHDAIKGAEESDGRNHDPDDQEDEFQPVNRCARGVSLYVLCCGREQGRGRSPGGRRAGLAAPIPDDGFEECFYRATHIYGAAWVAWARRSKSALRASPVPARRTVF